MDEGTVIGERPVSEPKEKCPRIEYNASPSTERLIKFPAWRYCISMREHVADDYVVSKDGIDRFICPVSLTLMLNPVGLVCGHVFDRRSIQDCIRKTPQEHRIAHKIKCPICRVLNPQSTLVPQPLVKALIAEKVEMKCTSAGCDQVMLYDQWEAHIKHACPHTRMLCAAKDEEGSKCGAIVTRQAEEGHELECPHRPVKCSVAGCSKILLYKSLKKHEEVCEFNLMDCACGERMTAKVNPAHRASVCPEEEVPCTICSVKLKRKDLEVHQSDPQSLAGHLIALTSRLQTSEAANENLRAENKDLAERLESVEIMKEDYIKLKAENETIHERLNRCEWASRRCERASRRLADRCSVLENRIDNGNNDDGRYDNGMYIGPRLLLSRPRRRGRSESSSTNHEGYESEKSRSRSRSIWLRRSPSRLWLRRSPSRRRSISRSRSQSRNRSVSRNRSESPRW